MDRRKSARLEFAAAIVSATAFGATAVWPTWIELVFGVDPDDGGGLLEWTIIVVSLASSIGAFMLARRGWRRGAMIGRQLVNDAGPGL